MSKKNKTNKKLPKLRFPEFRNAEEWEEKTLADISSRIVDKVGNLLLTPVSITAATGFVTQAEKFGRDISGEQYKNYIILNKGDFAYNKGYSKTFPQGSIYKLKEFEKVAAPNAFICFKFKKEYIGDFYQYYFEKNYHGIQLKKFITSGARGDGLLNINPNDFFCILFPSPSLPEQKKIADCLSSIDELISTHSQKLDKLKEYKKGLMQQLFPAEGETVPKLRFREFRKAGDWEEKKIEDLLNQGIIIDHLDGNHGELYPKSEEFSTDGIPYISANDFIDGFVDFAYCKYLPLERAKLFKKGVAKNGDILFAHNATVGPVAKLITTFKYVILSTTATYFRCDNKYLLNDFLKFSLSTPYFVKQYTRVMSQSTRNQVPITTQRKFNLHLPCLAEQQEIANCLSSLDELIFAQSQKLESLKVHKKGLMQKLFPSMDEDSE